MPTPVRGKNARIIVDGYELTGQTSGVIIEGTVGILEWMVLMADAVNKEPNFADVKITHNGYYFGQAAGDLAREVNDRIASAADTAVAAILGAHYAAPTPPVAYVIPTSFAQQMRVESPLANLMTVNGAWPTGSERAYRGNVVYYGDISATGGKPVVDLGAAGVNGGRAWLHIIGVTGSLSGAVDIDLESHSSTSFSGGEAVEATFTNAARGVQAQALSGSIGRYARINVGGLGGATALKVAVIAAVSGVHY